MRWTIMTAAALVLSAGTAWAAVVTGEMAPGFTATDTNGNAVSLEAMRGKTVILEWTNHQCPFVRKHYDSGNMQKLQADAAAAGMAWITIVSSAEGKQGFVTTEEANAIVATEKAAPAHKILDTSGDIGRLYGAKTTPHMYVIDAEGRLVYQGAIDSTPSAKAEDIATSQNYVTAALADLAAGKPVATPETQAYGCSVKY